ncbi:lactonase family protein [Gordonia sp. (in: high G+C Gram-positive bacteria)]|uniref:lactonase family protein n=1 Tax=Gordonia sp. (in: high G+C Gram-positive bacteria) TaxID=84139 RepID=UPI0039E63DDF
MQVRTRYPRLVSPALALALVAGGTWCAGSAATAAPSDKPTDFLYLNALGSDRITGLAITESGTIRRIPSATVPSRLLASSIKANPDGRTLYAAAAQAGVLVHRIGPDGSLRRMATRTSPVGAPLTIGVSPKGDSMAVVYGPDVRGGGLLQGYSIDAAGIPHQRGRAQPLGPIPFSGLPLPQVAFAKDGRNAYVANYMFGGIIRFAVGRDGAVTPRETAPGGMGPVNPTVTPDGRYLYTANENLPVGIGAYRILRSGRLAPVPGQPFAPTGVIPHGITITPSSRYLYVPTAISNRMAAYRILRGGALQPFGTPGLIGPSYAGNPEPGVLNGQAWVTADGKRLIAVDIVGSKNRPNTSVRQYRIAPNGALRPVPGSYDAGVFFSAASTLVHAPG